MQKLTASQVNSSGNDIRTSETSGSGQGEGRTITLIARRCVLKYDVGLPRTSTEQILR
jgi:hypothetical protein